MRTKHAEKTSVGLWGQSAILKAVWDVTPHMTKNLISLSILDKKWFIHVCKSSSVILKGVKRGTVYFLQGISLADYGVVSSPEIDQEDMTKLWDMRLRHMSEKGMQILPKYDILCGHKIKDLEFFEYCVFGKLHRNKFSKAFHRTERILDYIHVDCWGPSRVESLGGHMYFLSDGWLLLDDLDIHNEA